MELGRLLRPRTIAVVGASERDDSYAGETLLNLRGAGFGGAGWGGGHAGPPRRRVRRVRLGREPEALLGARVRVLPVAVRPARGAGRGGGRDPRAVRAGR